MIIRSDTATALNTGYMMEKVFFIPGQAHAIDYARQTDSGEYVSYWQSRTLAQLAEEYPGVVLGDEAEFLAQHTEALTTAPQSITECEYREALEVLPPLHWKGGDGFETFKFSEFYAGNITTIFVRKHGGAEHWKFRADARLSHDEIVARVREQAESVQRANFEKAATGLPV